MINKIINLIATACIAFMIICTAIGIFIVVHFAKGGSIKFIGGF